MHRGCFAHSIQGKNGSHGRTARANSERVGPAALRIHGWSSQEQKKKNESSNNLSIWWSWYVVGHRIRRSHAWCSRWQPPWLGCKESSRLLSNTRRQFTIVHYAMGCRAWWTKQQLYQTDKGRSCHLLHVWGRRKGKMGFGGSREP